MIRKLTIDRITEYKQRCLIEMFYCPPVDIDEEVPIETVNIPCIVWKDPQDKYYHCKILKNLQYNFPESEYVYNKDNLPVLYEYVMSDEYMEHTEKWYSSIAIMSSFEFGGPAYEKVKDWARNNTKEFLESILAELRQKPTWLINVLESDIFFNSNPFKIKGYVSLEFQCSMWLYTLEGTFDEETKDGILRNHYNPSKTMKVDKK